MEWYWILLITFGFVILYSLIAFPLWALMRAASLASRAEEKAADLARKTEERIAQEEKMIQKGDK